MVPVYFALIVLGVFLLMEGITWCAHKWVMHGFLWYLHEDHHQVEPGFFEKNDAFFVIFAVPSFLSIMYGAQQGKWWLMAIGFGIMAYGFAYFIVHDVIIHQRFKWFSRSNNTYVRAIRWAHKMHHKHLGKHDGESFGMLYVHKKYWEKVRRDKQLMKGKKVEYAQKPDYDYIILGGGCAGLSLIMHMLSSPQLSNKRILLIEKEQKNKNDRTWCFWEKGDGFFEKIVHRKWHHAWFHGEGYSSLKTLGPYAYKMIRGLDFYEYCYSSIRQSGKVDILHSAVEEIFQEDGIVQVRTSERMVTGVYAFNSIMTEKPTYKKDDLVLLQHFKGWIIETPSYFFETDKATLMDFRVNQDHGATFVYVMPLSSTQALVEYTLFTPVLLHDEQYEEGLKKYVADYLKLSDYRIIEKEFGIIPMTNHAFSLGEGNVVNMGTAGGQTKPSSGYTFRFIQKHVAAIVGLLEKGEHPLVKKSFMEKRFMWFDSVLLHILYHKKMTGSRVFTLLFSRNKIKRIFKFLDNETNLLEEFVLLNTLPQWPFMKAGWKEMKRS